MKALAVALLLVTSPDQCLPTPVFQEIAEANDYSVAVQGVDVKGNLMTVFVNDDEEWILTVTVREETCIAAVGTDFMAQGYAL